MVPIERDTKIFMSPLPKGYKKVIEEFSYKELCAIGERIQKEVNEKLLRREFPFGDGLFCGYEDRNEKGKKELLKQFRIKRVHTDGERGVFGVWAGGNIQSGDIYLTYHTNIKGAWWTDSFKKYSDFFEPKAAYCCHNMDSYWQALLTREFCIEYFNYFAKEIARRA